MKTRLSNWKEESDLYEVVTGKMTDKEALKKVSEKKGINNKVIINPKLSEAMEEVGGEVISVDEALAPSKQELNIMKKVNRLQLRLQKEKKKTTQKAEQIAKDKEKEEDIAVQQEEVGVSSSAAMAKARKEAELKAKEEAAVKKQKESTKKEEFEAAVEYFYAEGINEEGIDLIIEEVGLDDFVDFVDDSVELLTEERDARKMNVRTLKSTQKKAEEIKASKKDVVARSTPKDVLSRARTERAFKKRKLAKPTPAPKKEAPAPTKAKKAATVIKKARKATVAKSRKDFDGDGKKETPKQEHRGVRNKKITKAVAKAKPAQPKKPASKEGLRAKIKSAYEAGVKRHRKATQPVRVFHKGMKAGAKKAVKFAKDVKKVVSEEAGKLIEGDVHSGQGEKIQSRTLAWMKKKGQKGAPGLDAMKARTAEHKAKRGVKEEVVDEAKIDDVKYSKDEKRKNYETDIHTLSVNKGVRADRNKRYSATDVAFKGHAATHRDRMQKHYKSRGVKKEEVVLEKDLNAAERRALPNKDFALPGEGKGPEGKQAGSYPIPDEKHARSALSLVSQHGTPEEKAKVRAKVKKKFPGIKVSESRDKAFDMVVDRLRKKHGKDAVITKDSPKPKPPTEAQKKAAAAERQKRQEADNKAFASRAKKAGYKNPQDYANVVARYGSEDNMKKGRGLGT